MDVPIAEPTRDNVVVVAAALLPQPASATNVVTLAVRVRMAAGWHIQAVLAPRESRGAKDDSGDSGDDDKAGPGEPTTLELRLPSGVEPAGEWQVPEPTPSVSPAGVMMVHEQDVTFRRQLRILPSFADSKVEILCTIGYQACNDRKCLPPKSEALWVTAEN